MSDIDPFEAVARRAGAETRALPTSGGDPTSARRRRRARVVQRASAVTLATAVVVGGIATAVARRDDRRHIDVSNPSTTAPAPTVKTHAVPTTVAPTTVAPTTTSTVASHRIAPEATTFPPLLVTTADGRVARITPAGVAVVPGPEHVQRAYALSDGSIVTQSIPTWTPMHTTMSSTIERWFADGRHATFRNLASLLLVGHGIDRGHDVITVAQANDGGPALPRHTVLVVDVVTGTIRSAGVGALNEDAAAQVSVHGGHMTVSWSSYSAHVIEVRSMAQPQRTIQELVAPRGDLGNRDYYGGVLNPDGTRVAFVDNPGWLIGQPDVVVRSLSFGPELLRTSPPWPLTIDTLDYDGRFIVVCAAEATGPFRRLPTLVLDTAEAHPEWRQVSTAVGFAAIAG